MELRPNDLPTMEKGEIRRVNVTVAGAAGINTISGTPTATCDGLTIGTVSSSGLVISFNVTADKVGTYPILVSCDLSSNETIKGMVRAKVVDSTTCSTSDDYG